MRIVVHDFAGHPFQVQLSRSLARRGHTVFHLYCSELITPRGRLERQPGDPGGLSFHPVRPARGIEKSRLIRRWLQERTYARSLVRTIRELRPQAILSGNSPLNAQASLLRWASRRQVRFVFWVQDLIGAGAYAVLRNRFGLIGRAIGSYLRSFEGRLLRRSDEVIVITDDFRPLVTRLGTDPRRVHVIENWAPVDEMSLRPKDNEWSRKHGLVEKKVLIYSGTLGMKHNPGLLLELARRLRRRKDTRIVVVSEGSGAEWLAGRVQTQDRANLRLMKFQPFEDMPDVLASADVLLAILEPDAGVYSVPSKILTYLCSGRPILLAVPENNLAARIVSRSGAGVVVDPRSADQLIAAAEDLLDDSDRRAHLGRNGRRYAEATFGIEGITNRFEGILGGRDGASAW